MKFSSLLALTCLVPTAMAVYVTSADGTQIWAESTGDSTKPAVVFISGYTLSCLVFDKQWESSFMKKNLFMVRQYIHPPLPFVTVGFDHPTESVTFGVVGPIRCPRPGDQWPAFDPVRLRISKPRSRFQGRHRLLRNWKKEANLGWMVRFGFRGGSLRLGFD